METDLKNEYSPGHCNIGSKELAVRKKFLKLFIPLSIICTAGGFMWPANVTIWLFLIAFTFCSIVLITEVRSRFCVIFGFFSLYNFKNLGHLDEVRNVDHQKLDRKRVWEVIILSLLIAVVYATIIHVLALVISDTA